VKPGSEECDDAGCVARESALGNPADFVDGPSSPVALRPRLTTGLPFSPGEANRARVGFTQPSPRRCIGVTRPSVLPAYAPAIRSVVGGTGAPVSSQTLPDQTLPGLVLSK
jgi:hypothetical protein